MVKDCRVYIATTTVIGALTNRKAPQTLAVLQLYLFAGFMCPLRRQVGIAAKLMKACRVSFLLTRFSVESILGCHLIQSLRDRQTLYELQGISGDRGL